MEKRKNKIIVIIIFIVILLIIAGLVTLGILWHINENEKENKEIRKKKEIENAYTHAVEDFEKEDKPENTNDITKKNKVILEGYEVIGTIEIPKTDVHYPILKEVNERTLEIAISQIYTSSALNKPGNTVLYGQNYKNQLFFSRNDELQKGDTIYITDIDRNKIKYEIYDIFETSSTDTSFYLRTAEDTEGKCEITLSTCTDDARTTDNRLIILARESE